MSGNNFNNDVRLCLPGISLGAHGAGYAGSVLRIQYNITLGRITGLDPAGPYFTDLPISVRLDPTDAAVVDTVRRVSRPACLSLTAFLSQCLST